MLIRFQGQRVKTDVLRDSVDHIALRSYEVLKSCKFECWHDGGRNSSAKDKPQRELFDVLATQALGAELAIYTQGPRIGASGLGCLSSAHPRLLQLDLSMSAFSPSSAMSAVAGSGWA